MTNAIKICEFNEPIKGEKLTLWNIPWNELHLSPYQRKDSSLLKNRLKTSLSVIFCCPLLVVNVDDKWYIVDGQHRWAAFVNVKGNYPIPCIELPKKYMYHAMIYNIENSDKIKDSCQKVYSLYCDFAQRAPQIKESELSEFLLDSPYYISLAFAHLEGELSSPSLVETSVKKFDDWIDAPLKEAIIERRLRGEAISRLSNAVEEAAVYAGISGQGSHELKKAIISKTNKALWGLKRSASETFHEAIMMMVEHIQSSDWSFLGR